MPEQVEREPRELFRGEVDIAYGQLLILGDGWEGRTPELELAFAGQRNGLLGAGEPGALLLITGMHTGFVPVMVQLHDSAPPREGNWEEVVEATLVPGPNKSGTYSLGSLMSDAVGEVHLDARPYRVRYHVDGMDEAHQSEVRRRDEPEIDRYLLQFWPATDELPDAVLTTTSENAAYWHREARNRPSREKVLHKRAEAERQEQSRRDEAERDARDRPEHHRWGGVPPQGPITELADGPSIYKLDRALAIGLAELPGESQRQVMFWLLERGIQEAGLTEVEWLSAEVNALREGAPHTRVFQQHSLREAVRLLTDDVRVTLTQSSGLHNTSTSSVAQFPVLSALVLARRPHPGEALFGALEQTGEVFGGDRYSILFKELRANFPELAARPR